MRVIPDEQDDSNAAAVGNESECSPHIHPDQPEWMALTAHEHERTYGTIEDRDDLPTLPKRIMNESRATKTVAAQ